MREECEDRLEFSRVINASTYLANLIENHPYKERDAPPWIEAAQGAPGHALSWARLNKIIYSWSLEANVEKGNRAEFK